MRTHLNKTLIAAVKPPARGNRVIYDSEVRGFGVRVTANGVKAFVLTYRVKGIERRITIGRFPDLTTTGARMRALRLRGQIADGIDPLAVRIAERNAALERYSDPNVRQLGERYINEYARLRKKPSSLKQDRRLIDTKITPNLGKKLVRDVSRADVMDLHNRYSTTPYEANRMLSLLSKMFNLSELWGLRSDGSNPCRHVRKFPELKRERSFSVDELGSLGLALKRPGLPTQIADAIRLLSLTGCRVSEILTLQWSFVDLNGGVAHLPSSKTGPRVVALAPACIEILGRLQKKCEYVFFDEKTLEPITYGMVRKVWDKVVAAAGVENARLHDFRHTVGTIGAQTGMNSFLLRDVLGHKTIAMTARYVERNTDHLRMAADTVASKIAAAMAGQRGEVITLADEPRFNAARVKEG